MQAGLTRVQSCNTSASSELHTLTPLCKSSITHLAQVRLAEDHNAGSTGSCDVNGYGQQILVILAFVVTVPAGMHASSQKDSHLHGAPNCSHRRNLHGGAVWGQ